METIEQLQQDNAKLQERLNNAAKFFREQKAQIETLTNEVKEKTELALDYRNQIKTLTEKVDLLEHDAESFNGILESKEKEISELKSLNDDSIQAGAELGKENAELRAKLKKLEDNSISQEDFNDEVKRLNQTISECKKSYDERVEDISKLQMEVVKLEKDNADLIKYSEHYKAAYHEVLTENKQLKEQTENGVNNLEDLQKQLNEYELKLQNSEASYEQLNKKYEARKKQIAELTGNIEVQKNEYENKITSFKDDINKKTQEIEKLQIEKSDLEVNINDLTNRLSKSINGKTKYQEFTEMIINLVDSFNNNGNNIDTDKHSSITINTYKNSTGSQFMSDAPEMNI